MIVINGSRVPIEWVGEANVAAKKQIRRKKGASCRDRVREKIDADFAAMGKDAQYAKVSALIQKEFEYSDSEALKLADKDRGTKAPSRLLRSR